MDSSGPEHSERFDSEFCWHQLELELEGICLRPSLHVTSKSAPLCVRARRCMRTHASFQQKTEAILVLCVPFPQSTRCPLAVKCDLTTLRLTKLASPESRQPCKDQGALHPIDKDELAGGHLGHFSGTCRSLRSEVAVRRRCGSDSFSSVSCCFFARSVQKLTKP